MIMRRFDEWRRKAGQAIARRLEKQQSGSCGAVVPSDPNLLERVMQPGDVLLVEGDQKVSTAIKYLTQSTWSHAALYIGDALGERDEDGLMRNLVEVNLGEGCVAVSLARHQCYNTRICRPVGLTPGDRKKVVEFMISHIGDKYDTRNIFDLARYLFPTPPVPVRWRRRMIALGSGEPSRAICSSLIAEAFQQVRYPILPRIELPDGESGDGRAALLYHSQREILHIRHHSLFAPRDFDLSPFFRIIKPTIENGFDYKRLRWDESGSERAEKTGEAGKAGGDAARDEKAAAEREKQDCGKGKETGQPACKSQ